MPRALPKELRERVVKAYHESGASYEDIAEQFEVGRASLSRWLALARAGDLSPKPMGGARHERKVDEAGEKLIREHLDAIPDATLADLVEHFAEERGVTMHPRTMGRTVSRMGYTRKRGL